MGADEVPVPPSGLAARARAALAALQGKPPADLRRNAERRRLLSERYRDGSMRQRGPVSARSAVKALLRKGMLAGQSLWEPLVVELLARRWPRVVGEAFGVHTRPESLVRGTLMVVADAPAWADQVRLHEGEIVKRCGRAVFSSSALRAVRARVGELPDAVAPAPAKEPPAARHPIWEAIARREATQAIRDPELREAVVSWLARQAALDEKREGNSAPSPEGG